MLERFCDRCGKPTKKYNGRFNLFLVSVVILMPLVDGDEVDLCKKCRSELEAWLKAAKK